MLGHEGLAVEAAEALIGDGACAAPDAGSAPSAASPASSVRRLTSPLR
jgi:hypothetical protein